VLNGAPDIVDADHIAGRIHDLRIGHVMRGELPAG
jgi:hypothetical protein